jgi:hypothetical protein
LVPKGFANKIKTEKEKEKKQKKGQQPNWAEPAQLSRTSLAPRPLSSLLP